MSGHGIEPRDRRSRLRASHADRERVIGTLKAGYAYGLLTKDEFDTRVSQTFAARTYAELDVATEDIPAGLPVAPPPPARAPVAAAATSADRKARAVDRAIVITAVLAALAFFAAIFLGHTAAGGFIALGATASALASLCMTGTRAIASRRGTGSGRALPPASPPGAPGSLPAAPHPPSAIRARRMRQVGERHRPDGADVGWSGPPRPQVAS